MSTAASHQRLVAILAADVAGYSRLMSADQSATVAALEEARAVFRARIDANHGRIVDMAGDSVLAIFATAAGAVNAALAIQEAVNASADALPEDRRMRFRMGVHLGDVVEKADGSVYGDGVNIAARLQALAEPGGVWISDAVRGVLGVDIAVRFASQGPQDLKNIARPVRAYSLRFVDAAPTRSDRRRRRWMAATALAALVVLLAVAAARMWRGEHHGHPVAATGAPGTTATPAVVEERPSVAVLPFENRSDRSADVFFVDGIHDDILTQLSKVSALKVISRTSVEQFRNTRMTARSIATRLGVRCIVEGGVQRAGDRVRITVQLIDAMSDTHLWAESYDRQMTASNVFAIQSDVAAAVAGALKVALTDVEEEKVRHPATRNFEAWEAYQIGKQRMARRTSEGLADAERYYRRATELDPTFALAYAGLADTLTLQTEYSGKPKDAGLDAAELAATKAIELDPGLAEAWAAAGNAAVDRDQLDRAEQMFRRAIQLNPNYAPAHHWLSIVLLNRGEQTEALAEAERAVDLDPLSAIVNYNLGFASERLNRFDGAVTAYLKAIEIDPMMPSAYSGIGGVAAYGFGRFDKAIPWYEKAATLDAGNPAAACQLVLMYLTIGDAASARRWLDKALGSGEQYADTQLTAALFYLDRGDEASSRRHARIAATMAPSNTFLVRNDDLLRRDYASARARYAVAFPALLGDTLPELDSSSAAVAIELATVLQHTGESERASLLLDRSEAYYRRVARMGQFGYGIADVEILALRGDRAGALAALREAAKAGWRGPLWRYYRDVDPALAAIRDESVFREVFAGIERDLARQLTALAARPRDAPLDPHVT